MKNTGRCTNVLLTGARVALCRADSPTRKTEYDLVAVYSDRLGWVNIDSSAPNAVAHEWLKEQGCTLIRPEFTCGNSRFDFYAEHNGQRCMIEVKGCTLEREYIGYFPDAPTERGAKHLRELARLCSEGYKCYVMFVIQMNGVFTVCPNIDIDPVFTAEYKAALKAGVTPLFLPCQTERDRLTHDTKRSPQL